MSRHVLITGGSSGIGKALVERFARAGERVTFTYRSGKDRAEAIVKAHPGAELLALPYSQGEPETVDRLVASLPGPVDVLINNAGLGTKTVEALAQEHRQQDITMMQVNALGTLWLTEALLPAMQARGGKLVLLSSVGGGLEAFRGFRYSDEMSKAAIAHLGRQLALEMAREPVDVYTVCPGACDTPMFRASTLDSLEPTAQATLQARLPGGRLIRPEELAELIYFLCSPAGQVMRGAVIDASMGLGAAPATLENIHEEPS